MFIEIDKYDTDIDIGIGIDIDIDRIIMGTHGSH